ncbi:hypothetical protein JW968_02170 [Candidatus Woesearchaeota archaeon]|nr:hypothetical protein [Candidatus Woesearchaeota archaeon]
MRPEDRQYTQIGQENGFEVEPKTVGPVEGYTARRDRLPFDITFSYHPGNNEYEFFLGLDATELSGSGMIYRAVGLMDVVDQHLKRRFRRNDISSDRGCIDFVYMVPNKDFKENPEATRPFFKTLDQAIRQYDEAFPQN